MADTSSSKRQTISWRTPHPLRVQSDSAQLLAWVQDKIGPAEWSLLTAMLKDQAVTLADIYPLVRNAPMPIFMQFIQRAAEVSGTSEVGGPLTVFAGLRHEVAPYPFFKFEDELVALLMLTDVDQDVPVSMIRPAYPRMYIELGQARDIPESVENLATGSHVLEGAYVELGEHPLHGKSLLVLFTGAPQPGSALDDDATLGLSVNLEDPSKPLSVAVAESIQASAQLSRAAGFSVAPYAHDRVISALQLIIKALLYIGLPNVRRREELSLTKAKAALAGKKNPAKAAKAARQLVGLSDFIWISPPADWKGTGSATSQGLGARATHWRRGHYRRQHHGPNNAQVKLIFIAPFLVNPEIGTTPPAAKNYRVK